MSPDAVYLSHKGMIIEANQAAADLFGFKRPQELAGQALADFVHPDSRSLMLKRERDLLARRVETPLVEEKLLRPDGSVIYVEVKSRSFRHQGRVLVQSIARDISERKKVEQELLAFKNQMEYVLEATRTSLAVIDTDLNITYLSPNWERKLGPPTSRKCYQYFENRNHPCHPCRIMDAIRNGKKVVIEEPWSGDEKRTVQVHIVPFQDQDGNWLAAEFTIDITDLKSIQVELARRQTEVLTLLDNIPAGVFFKDHAGRYLLANRLFCQMAGLTQQQLTGRTDEELFPPETARRNRRNEELVFSSKAPFSLGEGEILLDGKRAMIETRMVPVSNGQDKTVGIIGIHYNITERKQAEEQIRHSALQWQITFDSINDGIALVDNRGVILRSNQALEKMLERKKDDINGHELCSLISDEGAQNGLAFIKDLALLRQRANSEVKLGEKWLSMTIDPIIRTDGTIGGYVLSLKDITEMRKAQETTRLMLETIEQMEEGVVIFDTSDRIVYVNPAMERITGYTRQELIGRCEVVPKQSVTAELNEYWRNVWRKVAAERVWRGSKTSVRKDGSPYEQELVASALLGPDSRVINYLVVVRDVTEQRRLQSIAETVNSMNNIGYVFSGVRHELGNPVNSIKAATSILCDRFDSMDDHSKREYLERIASDIKRLEAILKTLRSFSMFDKVSLEAVELCSFVRDLMPTFQLDFGKANIGFDYRFPGQDCMVWADRQALYQILVNLLTNAFNALRDRERPSIIIRISCAEVSCRLEVEDNGTGMTEEVRRNIFKPFYTTRPGGTGLGMVICQKLVLAMNGYLEVDSATGRGSVISIILPSYQKPAIKTTEG